MKETAMCELDVSTIAAMSAGPSDEGARLNITQINDRLAPVSINVAGLSALGFEPVAQVKASRFYRERDFPAICAAIARHVQSAAHPLAA
jgi:hypothetical protein